MYVVVSFVLFVLVVGALVDIITKQDGQVKHLPKVAWVLLVIFLPLVGSILWFALGREYNSSGGPGGLGELRRRQQRPTPPRAGAATDVPRRKTTEEELADLDREIEFYEQQARIKRLEAEIEERRKRSE